MALGRQEARAPIAENVLLNMTLQSKGKGKGHRSRSAVNVPERQGKEDRLSVCEPQKRKL